MVYRQRPKGCPASLDVVCVAGPAMLTSAPQRFSKTRLTGGGERRRERVAGSFYPCPSHPLLVCPPVYGAKSLAKKDLLSKSVGGGPTGGSGWQCVRVIYSSLVVSELPDPFAKVVVEDTGQCHATDVQKGTLDPKWNHHFDL